MSKWVQTEETAARWLLRSEEPEWSDADQAQLDAWLAADDEHRVALLRLKRAWTTADRLAALRAPSTATPMPGKGLAGRRRQLTIIGMAVAAGLIGLTVLLPGGGPFGAGRVTTDVGAQKTVGLPDGSRIELNTATRLKTAVDDHRREVWLDKGEAYFDVAHDARRPFVVHAGRQTITVLGTRFSVFRDGDEVRVAVLQGRVRVDEALPHHATAHNVIEPGTIAVVDGASTMITKRSVDQVAETMSWREGRLVFDQVTLAEAIAEFNRYNRKQLVIADPDISAIRIGGRFEASNVEAFIRLLRRGFGLKIEEDDKRVTISG